jgi:hypothetical protein
MATSLGEDYTAVSPQTGAPIDDVLERGVKTVSNNEKSN